MLTADQINVLGDKAQQLLSPVTEYLIEDIARRISEAGKLTSTASYQTWRLQQLGVSQRQLKKELRKRLKVSHRELRRLLNQSAEAGYDYDIRKHPYVQAVPFRDNAVIQSIVTAAVQLADDDLTNITQTIGFVCPDGQARELTRAYQNACDFAFKKVSTGAQDYASAIRQATRNLSDKGIVTIDYESGVHTSLEASVRRSVIGGLGLMQEQISKQNHDDFGCDGWEISAHDASAPDHEPIQGRQYSDAEYERLNNSLVRRIGTLNCGHNAFPVILGVDSPQYSQEELERFRKENEKGIDYDGRHYTKYEATQRQRKLERAIRKQKRRILVDDASGDQENLKRNQVKYQVLNQEYKRFSKAAGLRLQHERMEMGGFGPKQANSSIKTLDVAEKTDIIDARNKEREEITVRTIGRIDPKKFKAVSSDIRTDEVVITDERIAHIKERHPNDFERYESYIKDIVENPQYILEDKVKNTAVILNEYVDDEQRFRLILRLAVPKDPPEYKNSIITFMEISERKFRKYLRNKKILYRNE